MMHGTLTGSSFEKPKYLWFTDKSVMVYRYFNEAMVYSAKGSVNAQIP
jgi:hypothetical protein